MAVRIANTNEINFGVAGAAVTVTHVRITLSITDSITLELTNPVAVPNANKMAFNAGDLALVYQSGDFGDDHMKAVVESYFGVGATRSLSIDLMSSSTYVLNVSGYSSQTVSAWTLTTEDDA